jgi:hypothetical protein
MIADRKLSFHNNLQHSVCFHVFIYPDTLLPTGENQTHNITNDEHNYMSSYSERGDYGKR